MLPNKRLKLPSAKDKEELHLLARICYTLLRAGFLAPAGLALAA